MGEMEDSKFTAEEMEWVKWRTQS